MNGVRVFARMVGRGLSLLTLCGVWLAIVGVGGVVVYRLFFHFEATDWSNWTEMRRLYLAGATIPFDFVALAFGLPLFGLAGCLVLALRFHRLSAPFLDLWPGGRLPRGFSFPSLPAVRWIRFPVHRDRRRAATGGIGGVGRPVRWVLSLGRMLIRWGWRMARRSPGERTLAAGERACEEMSSSGPGVPAGLRCAAAETLAFGSAETPARRPAPLILSQAQRPAATEELSVAAETPAEPEVAAASLAEPSDDDYAVFGRIMALFEVWADPAPDWMRAALQEEIDALSEVGWSLFAHFGEPAMAQLEIVAAAGLLPRDPTKRAVVQGLLDSHRARAVPDDLLPEAFAPDILAAADDVGSRPSPPVAAARLSMNAAWLCEMVDNFVMLEDIRTAGDADGAPSFENRWGAIYRETGERLKIAMQAMTDEDWRSIDQFPDRAGRIRVQTDRLREELRFLPADAGDPPIDAAGPSVLSPSPESAVLPAEPSPVVTAAAGNAGIGCAPPMPLEEILRAAGYVVRTLPAMRGGSAIEMTDYLAQRDDFSVLLRVADLSGDGWNLEGDSLAPWRGGMGRALPSPCRAVWQRLSLLRSLGKETKPCAGVVVLKGGHFTDEQAVARIIARDRRRTDVDLAWLDRSSSTLPDLPAWLVRMESSRSGGG